MADIEYEIDFDDPTLLESGGNFTKVEKIMAEDLFAGKSWMLLSNTIVRAYLGEKIFEAMFVLQFYGNGKVIISDYSPSTGDVCYNPDIRGLSMWLKNNGWASLSPSKEMVRENISFWKHFWETFLIDSDYLDERFGERDQELQAAIDD